MTDYRGYVVDDFVNADSPELAAAAFCAVFEKPRGTDTTRREEKAREYYEEFKGRGLSALAILEQCEAVMNDLLDHNVQYTLTNLRSGDIEDSGNFSKWGCCCATYVSTVLYRSGCLSAEHINKYLYHWTGGVDAMLRDAGWILVSEEEAQAGDVCVWDAHTFIYAGGNNIWDQQSGCISSSGSPPARGTLPYWNTWKANNDLHVWRVPYSSGRFEKQEDDNKYGTYTSSSGRTYIEWKQTTNNYYGQLPWYNNKLMGATGCAAYSATMLLNSAGIDVDPGQVHSKYYYGGGTEKVLDNCISTYGRGSTAKGKVLKTFTESKFISLLKSGKGVMVYVGSKFNNLYTDSYHWIVVADIRETELDSDKGYDVYVLTSTDKGRGWQKIETVTENLRSQLHLYIED